MEYSVVIRTLGTGGEKYQTLLDSINGQTIKPSHVYVFIAEGYDLPIQRLGYETFVYTKKGMWHQRVYGMQYVAEKHPECFQLVCDDDISFASNFVEELLLGMQFSEADVMTLGVGIIGNKKRNIKLGLLGNRFETNNDDYRIKIAPTAGFIVSTSRSKKIIPTQSGAFACFMIKSTCIHSLNLEDEYWVEEAKYALPDDQVFFYKCYKKGLKLMHSLEPRFQHLDHGSSDPSRSKDRAYASSRNFLIFWHRFLYKPSKGLFPKINYILCITYRLLINGGVYLVQSVRFRKFEIIKCFMQGIFNGIQFVCSSKYKHLRNI